MATKDWFMIGFGLVISFGGFIGTIVVATLTFFIKRLINSVDTLTSHVQRIDLALKDRPEHHWVETTAHRIADTRVTKHESEKH